MFFLRTLFLFVFCSLASAEHKTEPNQIYNRSSQNTVDAINNTTKLFRDPTQLSDNFRQVLNTLKSEAGTNAETQSSKIPQIKLIGKVFVPKTTNALALTNNSSSVVLEIGEQVHYLKEGATCSIVIKEHLNTIRVEEITQYYVKLIVQPSNETLVLH